MAHGGQETEIKLRMADVKTARQMLVGAGFRVSKRRVFEVNIIYDTAEQTLRNSSRLVRIREAGGKGILTYKGPPVVARHKSREELEVEIAEARSMELILERLGFCPIFRYEKYRTEYQRGNEGVAMVDEVPIGVYVELEGPPEWIDRTAARLGFSESDYIHLSYGRLYLDWCAQRGIHPTHMVFS